MKDVLWGALSMLFFSFVGLVSSWIVGLIMDDMSVLWK